MPTELPPCRPNIYKDGHMVMLTHSIPSAQIEEWVKKVADISGQPVDWHFAGGRACILALGDLSKVYDAIHWLLPWHNRLQKAASDPDYWPLCGFQPRYTLYASNEINTAHEYVRAVNTEREAANAR